MEISYIANQLSPEGLDEVQRLVLCYALGHHAALAGPHGLGKTTLVGHLPRITRRGLYDITCDEKMGEAPFIGWPELAVVNGTDGESKASKTVWRHGISGLAAIKGGILYLDEVEKLPETVQKRHNSLVDHRRVLRRRDKRYIEATPEFFCVISYNPTNHLAKNDLADSFADRFVHINFSYLQPSLEAAIALGGTEHLTLETRGIMHRGIRAAGESRYVFLQRQENNWVSFFTKETAAVNEAEIWSYRTLVTPALEIPAAPIHTRTDLAIKIAELHSTVRTFSDDGTNHLPDEIKRYLADIGEMSQVQLHKPSPRILQAAIKQYDTLISLGMEQIAAQTHAVRLCIDQICYGKHGDRRLGKATVRQAITKLAEFHQLLGAVPLRTDFTAAPGTGTP